MPLAFDQIEVGSVFLASRCFGPSEMDQFAGLSGDYSAIHTDPAAARRLGFTDRLQYGFLMSALLSGIVGSNFQHAVCAAVAIDFVQPAVIQDAVEVRAEVTQKQEAVRSAVLKITMRSGTKVIARGKLTTIFMAPL